MSISKRQNIALKNSLDLEGNIVPNIGEKGDLHQAHPKLTPETEILRPRKPRPHPRSRGIMDGKGQKQMKKSLLKMKMDQLLSMLITIQIGHGYLEVFHS